ncbi:hypothetical protein [Hahella ganghwensis]|uniref:hypothetical protein n=1 Tax=Hahella ganghwensis TaxID=286420 RepID=UPI0003812778|nr:hypothetical protein [Hahella ganghwensis]
MNQKSRLLAVTLFVTISGWIIYSIYPADPSPSTVAPSTTSTEPSAIAKKASQPSTDKQPVYTQPHSDPELSKNALLKLREYQSLFETREDIRDLIEKADELDDQTRQERFEQLIAEMKALEQENKVTSAESLLLQLAALKFSPYPEQAKEQGKILIDQYKQLSEARLKEFQENPDPRFVSYKEQEAEIVKEVMKMSHYPDGLSREKYLAQRLQDLRSEVYKVD